MEPHSLFIIIIAIIIADFIIDKCIDYLNAKHFNDEIPNDLKDVYNEEEYYKSQAYKRENYKFSLITSSFSIILTLAFFIFKGFSWIDGIARGYSENDILITLIFFGIIMIGSDILTTPFSFYQNFVIEEKYGFNKSTKRLFFIDKIKGWVLSILIGGGILALIVWFYQKTGDSFWLYTWLFMGVFTVFMTMFYSSLIVPIFNKQTPLEDGELKTAIENFANKVDMDIRKAMETSGVKKIIFPEADKKKMLDLIYQTEWEQAVERYPDFGTELVNTLR